jgi:P27 family predicted phage terminase small subunit
LAETYSEYIKCQDFIKKYGEDYMNDAGEVKQYPAVKRMQDARKDFHRMIREFGSTPSSRSGVAPLKNKSSINPFTGKPLYDDSLPSGD